MMKQNAAAYPESHSKFHLFSQKSGKIQLTQFICSDTLMEHKHGFIEIICITEGCGIHILDGQKFRVKRGDIFLIDYGITHGFQALNIPFTWISCIFRPESLGSTFSSPQSIEYFLASFYPRQLGKPSKNVSLIRNLCPIKEDWCYIFDDMLLEYNNKPLGYMAILEHHLTILLTKIARVLFSNTLTVNETVHFDVILPDIIRRLNNSLPGSISAKELADHYFISPSTFSINFKKAMGCSFVEYVTNLRIRQACSYLLTTDANIYDIQTQVGYRDAKSFYHAFRRYTGMTPTEYKASHQTSENSPL